MATENNNKTLNVPNLRFSEFSKSYSQTTISKLATIVGGGTPDTTFQEFWNGGIQWFTPSEIGKNKYADKSERTISQEGLNNSSAKLLPINTILLSTRATIGESSIAKVECCTNQGFQSLIANEEIVCYEYLYYLVATLKKELIRKSCGSTFLEISANEVRKIKTFIPSIDEQSKVSLLLSLIDERIATQIKIIEDLKKLKSAISKILFEHCERAFNIRLLGDICKITTGKLDANAMTDDGEYPFFTCAREDYRTDTYAFEGDSLLISGNGEIGIVKRYNGKFNAYQRTYVLQNFSENIEYLMYYIEYHLPKRVLKEKNVGAMPYIVLSTLSEMPIKIPDIKEQCAVCRILNCLSELIELNSKLKASYTSQKSYLLAQMFI